MNLIPPMTMMDFFRKSEGNWFTERSVHHFDSVADESGKSNFIVQVVEKDDPRVEKICRSQGIDPQLAKGGGSFSWQDNLDDSEPNPNYAAVLIDVPDDETGLSGKLIRDRGYVENIAVISRYWFGKDGLLTIDTDYDNNQGQERCWFVTDDFRIRVSTARMMNGISLISYSSERRCVPLSRLEEMVKRHSVRSS
jgi:hypothetical protein